MVNLYKKLLLVGDNPFHNISHLSQERVRARTEDPGDPKFAASLVATSFENGANGFMFSVDEATLSILSALREEGRIKDLSLCAIVPYAYEYVRLSTQLGGISGLAKNFAKEIAVSGKVGTLAMGLKGVLTTDPVSLMKTYLVYELSRIRSSAGKQVNICSMLLHQLITDMALALDAKWLFKSYVDFLLSQKVTPGFNTGNFTYLVNKFTEWNVDMRKVLIAAPFNKVGFQMIPSRMECEKALSSIPEPVVVAISIMAAGFIRPKEAIDYITTLPNIKGVAVGVSKESHSRETFRFLDERLNGKIKLAHNSR